MGRRVVGYLSVLGCNGANHRVFTAHLSMSVELSGRFSQSYLVEIPWSILCLALRSHLPRFRLRGNDVARRQHVMPLLFVFCLGICVQ
jgi:hypothetical protein